jgi:hypothetical protein
MVRNPFDDKQLRPHRTERPRIVRILPLHPGYKPDIVKFWKRKAFTQIELNSPQFGALDLANGHFFPLGQN